MKIVVLHSYYGCDTGCCGHVIEVDDDTMVDSFHFAHPNGEDPRSFAESLVREHFGEDHVKDLDWENCFISND